MPHDHADAFPDGSPRALLWRLVEEVFHGRSFSALDDLLAEDFRDHGDGSGTPRDQDANVKGVAAFLAAIPDLHQEIELIVADDDLVAVSSTFRGTHRGP